VPKADRACACLGRVCRRIWEFRLPTESQWSNACRACTNDRTLPSVTSSAAAHSELPARPQRSRTGAFTEAGGEVGSYPANSWGLHDMHGMFWNVPNWYIQIALRVLPRSFDLNQKQRDSSRVRRCGCGPTRAASVTFLVRFEPEPVTTQTSAFALSRLALSVFL